MNRRIDGTACDYVFCGFAGIVFNDNELRRLEEEYLKLVLTRPSYLLLFNLLLLLLIYII